LTIAITWQPWYIYNPRMNMHLLYRITSDIDTWIFFKTLHIKDEYKYHHRSIQSYVFFSLVKGDCSILFSNYSHMRTPIVDSKKNRLLNGVLPMSLNQRKFHKYL
jgi:hypothetical protein